MNKEEAIKQLKKHKQEIDKQYISSRYSKAIEVVLNLIEKQEKEIDKKDKRLNRQFKIIQKRDKQIEELKQIAQHDWEERCRLTFELENSTSNDKIKAKIEEIDNVLKNNYLIDKLKNYFKVQKEVLQSLLEKE